MPFPNSHSRLNLEDVKKSEDGVYRCRVDFKTAPTRNTLVNLTVIGEFIAFVLFSFAGLEKRRPNSILYSWEKSKPSFHCP